MQPETLAMIMAGNAKKGDVLGTARIAGIMAAKKTHELIPLCHPLLLTKVSVDIDADPALPGLRVTALARVAGKTGVEMEALTAASVACLTDLRHGQGRRPRHGRFPGMRLVEKTGGKSGDFRARLTWRCSRSPKRWRACSPMPRLSGAETVPLAEAAGRVLAGPSEGAAHAAALRGIRHGRLRGAGRRCPECPARLDPASARRQPGSCLPAGSDRGEAVRIFTGAPVPEGADTIAIQENVRVLSATASSRSSNRPPLNRHIRGVGLDFPTARCCCEKGRMLDPAALSLAAAANHPTLPWCASRWSPSSPRATNCCRPAATRGPTRSSPRTAIGVAAIAAAAGARVLDLGIAPDRVGRHRDAGHKRSMPGRRHRHARRCVGRRP